MSLTWWTCYRRARRFVHARHLVSHFVELHGEQPG